jgi:hypothetical protein
MGRSLKYLLPLLIAGNFLASSAQVVKRTYLLRAETTVFDPYSGMTHTCMLVFPDGQYRLEKSFQGTSGSPDEHVYLDTLPQPLLAQLSTVVDDPKFQDLKTDQPKGGIIPDMDTLFLSVPRTDRMQNLYFMTAQERHPFDKALKPFQNWMKSIQKRKVTQAKSEKANDCKAPLVYYRARTSVTGNQDEAQP